MLQTLKNGAEVLERKGDVALCRWPKGNRVEFVTWRVDSEGNAYLGHYFVSLSSAYEDFRKRAK